MAIYLNRCKGSSKQPRQTGVQEVNQSSKAVGNSKSNEQGNQGSTDVQFKSSSTSTIPERNLTDEVDELCNMTNENDLQCTGVPQNSRHSERRNKTGTDCVPVVTESTQDKEIPGVAKRSDEIMLGTNNALEGVCSPSKSSVVRTPGFCCDCGERFELLAGLVTHALTHTGKSLLTKVAEPARKELLLEENLSKSVDKRNHQCNVCDKSFKKLAHLVSHRRCHAKKPPSKHRENKKTDESAGSEGVSNVAVVVDETNTLPSLRGKRVVNVCAKGAERDRCKSCGRFFRKLSYLSSRMRCKRCGVSDKQKTVNAISVKQICDESGSVDVEKRVHKCDRCRQSFRERSHLLTHMRLHRKTSGKQKIVSSESENEVHAVDSVERDKTEHDCGICGRSFKALSHLLTHIRYHTKLHSKQKQGTGHNKDAGCGNQHGGDGGSGSRSVDSDKRVMRVPPPSCSQSGNLHSLQMQTDGLKHFTSASSTSINTPVMLDRPLPSAGSISPAKESVGDVTERYCSEENQETTDTELEDEDTPTVASKTSKSVPEHSLAAAVLRGENNHFFSCECGEVFRSSLALAKHSNVHLQRQEYICSVCGKMFAQKCVLVSHLRFHNYQKDYKCIKCDTLFARYNEFVVHKRIHRFRVPCCVCRKLVLQSTCGRQQTRSHSRHKKYYCTSCDKSREMRRTTRSRRTSVLYSTDSDSSSSADAVVQGSFADAEETLMACSLCNKPFTDAGIFQQHMNSHFGDCAVLLECVSTVPKKQSNDGDKGIKTIVPDNLQHRKGAADSHDAMGKSKQVPEKKKEIRCQCGRTFRFLSTYKRHLCKLKGHECNICKMVFRQRIYLDNHMRRHTGKKKYNCSICLEQFTRLRELLCHRCVHTEKTTPDNDHQNKRQLASSKLVESSQEDTVSNDGQKTLRCDKTHRNPHVEKTNSDCVGEQPTKRQCLKANVNSKSNLENAGDQRATKSNTKPHEKEAARSNIALLLSSKVSVNLEKDAMTGDTSENLNDTWISSKHKDQAEKAAIDHNDKQSKLRQPPWMSVDSEENLVVLDEDEDEENDNDDNSCKALSCDLKLGKDHNSRNAIVALVSEQQKEIPSVLDEDSESDINVEYDVNAVCVKKTRDHRFMKKGDINQVNKHQRLTEPILINLEVYSEENSMEEENNDSYNNRKTICGDHKLSKNRSFNETTVDLVSEQSNKIQKYSPRLVEEGNNQTAIYLSKSHNNSFAKKAAFDSVSKHRNTAKLLPNMNSEENTMADGGGVDDENNDDAGDDDDSDCLALSCNSNLGNIRNSKDEEHTNKKLDVALELDKDSQSNIKRHKPIDQMNKHRNIELLLSRSNSAEQKGTMDNRELKRVVHKSHEIHHSEKAPDDFCIEQPKKKQHLSLECEEISNSNVETRGRCYKREKQNHVDNMRDEQTKKSHSALQVGKSSEAGENPFTCNVCYRPFADSDALQVHKHVWGNVPCNINRWQNSIQSRPSSDTRTDAVGSRCSRSDVEKGSTGAKRCGLSECCAKEKYQCCCGKKYHCQEDLTRHAARKQEQRHILSCSDGKKHKCKYCNKLFKLSSELLLHKLDCDRRKYRIEIENERTRRAPPLSKSFAAEEPGNVPMLLSVPVLVNGTLAWGSVVALR